VRTMNLLVLLALAACRSPSSDLVTGDTSSVDSDTADSGDSDSDSDTDADSDSDTDADSDSDTDADTDADSDADTDTSDTGIDTGVDPLDADSDADGFTARIDCDETDPDVHPLATELCDGLDNDCDNAIPATEVDADTDGYLACAECDDTNGTVHPGATEVLNDGVDQDCDGTVETVSVTSLIGNSHWRGVVRINSAGPYPSLYCDETLDITFEGSSGTGTMTCAATTSVVTLALVPPRDDYATGTVNAICAGGRINAWLDLTGSEPRLRGTIGLCGTVPTPAYTGSYNIALVP
jgi:hypothetical protein